MEAVTQPWCLGVPGQRWHTRTVSYLPPMWFTTGFLSSCHDLPAPGEAAGCRCSSSFWQLYHWPGKEHSPCQRVRQPPLFAKCCPTFLEVLPYLVASSCTHTFVFSDFPTTNLCLSGHLTLETGCKRNMFKSAISHILPKSKTSIIHMISVPSFHLLAQQLPHSPGTWV